MRLANGIAAPLKAAEVERLEELAAAAGFKSVAIFAAEKLRELVLGGGHGGSGELGTASASAHEILTTQSGAVVASSAPEATQPASEVHSPLPAWDPTNGAGGSEGSTPEVRQWKDLEEAEKLRLAQIWMVKVPLPPAFREYSPKQKAEWVNLNWPLDKTPGEEQQEAEW